MKKLNLWLLASLFVAALTLTACSKDDDDKDDPKKEQLSAKDLIGTWTYTNSLNENYYFLLTLGEDNTFSLSAYDDNTKPESWDGTWAEEDGHIVVTATQYTDWNGNSRDVENQFNLYYKKIANGILIYADGTLPRNENVNMGLQFGGIFVPEGESLDESKIQIADKELIGEWETEDHRWHFTFHADGTYEKTDDNQFMGLCVYNGRFAEIEPLSVGEGESIKQFVEIIHHDAKFPSLKVNISCYVIQDDKLYYSNSIEHVTRFIDKHEVKSIEDLLPIMDVYTKVTEE